jgi:hypothetical protein
MGEPEARKRVAQPEQMTYSTSIFLQDIAMPVSSPYVVYRADDQLGRPAALPWPDPLPSRPRAAALAGKASHLRPFPPQRSKPVAGRPRPKGRKGETGLLQGELFVFTGVTPPR